MVQLSVHVFFSFSGSPLTGTLRGTLPVSRTKTGVCCMFCVKETSQNGNILRSEGQISSSSLFRLILHSFIHKYLFDHIYKIRFAMRFKVLCPTVESDNSYCDKFSRVLFLCIGVVTSGQFLSNAPTL